MKEGQRFKHKGNGKIYEITRLEDFEDFTIKQDSINIWESVVPYIDIDTYQPFLTGINRFKERFTPCEDK